jgi:hypothetical protein
LPTTEVLKINTVANAPTASVSCFALFRIGKQEGRDLLNYVST